MTAIKPGTVVDGRYEIESRLGAGGMGVVYLAKQTSLGRKVAIKMLLPELSRGAEERVRFRREARVMSQLRHENAAEVYDYGDWDGRVYLVMELLNGLTLRDRLVTGKPYDSVQAVLKLGFQLADVLVAAHDLSLVHRDLKPENVMLEKRTDGTTRAVVVDFGLAFLIHGAPDLNRVTAEGMISGTPQYMAPEQARGVLNLTPAADVYALGVVLWEMLVGEPPFDSKRSLDLINMHMFVPPRSMRKVRPEGDIPMALDDLVLSMLEKSATARPTAAQVRERIGELLLGGRPRDRGRPDALIAERSKRMITRGPGAAEETERFDFDEQIAAAPPVPDDPLRIHVIGSLTATQHVLLGASGFTQVSQRGKADVIWVLEGHEVEITDDIPVVATRPFESAAELAALVRAGFAEVLRPGTSDDTIVKRLRRAARRHQSQSRST